MRVFHHKVYDEILSGTNSVYTDPKWNAMLALCDEYRIVAIVDQVTVTGTATISVDGEDSPDTRYFASRGLTGTPNQIWNSPISSTDISVLTGNDAGSSPMSGFARLRIQLAGTNPQAHVQIWVTGRGTLQKSAPKPCPC